ncbi:MAG: hypothetical protein WD294_10020 [Phycisphaeraceae bacterium]
MVLPVVAMCGTSVAFGHGEDADHEHPPADAAAVTDAVRVGKGEATYESVPNWCQLPEGRSQLGATHGGIVVDNEGLIYFSMDSGENGILVYTPEGEPVKGIAPGMTGIHGMTLREEDGEEFIYAAHLAGKRVVKLTLDGEIVWSIDGAPTESGKYDDPNQYNPTSVAVAPNGAIFVADGYGTQWIHQFDADREYVRSFGGPGSEPGKFQTCHGIAIDARDGEPKLLVADRENRRLQHFDLEGNFLAVITTGLRRPCSVSIRGDKVAIAELAGRVAVIDSTNKVISVLGDNPDEGQRANFGVPPAQWKEAVFTAPHGVSYDADGNLYVMDWNRSGRISRLNHVQD